jgi:hypothetical protein
MFDVLLSSSIGASKSTQQQQSLDISGMLYISEEKLKKDIENKLII